MLFHVHHSQDARAAPYGNQKTKTVNREHKTAVSIGFDIAKKNRGSGADFDNRNNTTSKKQYRHNNTTS